MDQNVSASPGDADNLVRKKPNAQTDATAPSGIDAAVANAKAGAQVAGRTEFMASKLSTVRDASRSEEPTPVSLPKLQPIVGANLGAVAASDLPTTATTVQGTGDPPPVIAKINWHDVAPPSGDQTTVIVPPTNGSVSVEGIGTGNSSTGKRADGKGVRFTSAETLTAGINPSPLPAESVSNPSGNLTIASTDQKPPAKPLVAAVEPAALTTIPQTNVALNQPSFNAITALSTSDLLSTGSSTPADQTPLRLNISFQPTNQTDITLKTSAAIASEKPAATQPEIKAKSLSGVNASLNDKSPHAAPPTALALGQLFETGSPTQTSLVAATGASAPDAIITQFHGPLSPNSLTADASRLTSLPLNLSDGSLPKNLTIARAPADLQQPILPGSISPYSVSFSQLDFTVRPDVNSSTLLTAATNSDQLIPKPPLQLALANSVPLVHTDYSVDTLPAFATVSLRPTDFDASITPLVVQTALSSPSTDFRPTKNELSTTPIILSAALSPLDNSVGSATQAPLTVQPADLTLATNAANHGSFQVSNVAMGDLIPRDGGVFTATPMTLATDLLHTTSDTISDNHVTLASNMVSATSSGTLVKPANFPLAFAAAEAIPPSSPIDLASPMQALLPNSDGARPLLVSQPLITEQATASNNGLIARPWVYDQSHDATALASMTTSTLPGQADFSLAVSPSKTPTIEPTLVTLAANSDAAYRPPLKIAATTFQPIAGEPVTVVSTSLQTTLNSTPTRLNELTVASNSLSSSGQPNLNLGTLLQPDASASKPNNSVLATNPLLGTTSDATPSLHTAELATLTSLSSDLNLTSASINPSVRSAEPIQLAGITRQAAVEQTNLLVPNLQPVGSFIFDPSGTQEMAATVANSGQAASLSKNGVVSETKGIVVASAPTAPYSESLPSTVFTAFSGNSPGTGFHVNDQTITPLSTTQVPLVTASLLPDANAGLPALRSNDAANAAFSTTSGLAMGSFIQPDAQVLKSGGSTTLPDSHSATVFDTVPLAHTAEITKITSLVGDSNLTATYIPPTGSSEPIQLASINRPITDESSNLANYGAQRAGSLAFNPSITREVGADVVSDPVKTVYPAKGQHVLATDGITAQPIPKLAYSETTLPGTISTAFTGDINSTVFRVNDETVSPVTSLPSPLATAYLTQRTDFTNPNLSGSRVNEPAITALSTPSNLAIASFVQPDPQPNKPNGSTVVAESHSATVFDATSGSRTADVATLTNLGSDANSTATFITAKSSETIQLAGGYKPASLATQTIQAQNLFVFDNSASREIPTSQFTDPVQTAPVVKPTTTYVANLSTDGLVHTYDPSLSPLPSSQASLGLGVLVPVDAGAVKASGTLVAASSSNATTFEMSPTARSTEIKYATNLSADPTLTTVTVPVKSESIQLASAITPTFGDQSNLATRGTQLYQSLAYPTAATRDFSTYSAADAVPVAPQNRNGGYPQADNTVIASGSSSVPSYDAAPSQVKPSFVVASLNQPVSTDYSNAAVPATTTVNFRSGTGDSAGSPITVQVADLRNTANSYPTVSNATESSATALAKNSAEPSRVATTAANLDLSLANGLRPASGSNPSVNTYASIADAQSPSANGQAGLKASSQEAAQSSGGYARLSTSSLANTTLLNSADVHASPPTALASNLTGLSTVMPLDGANKNNTGFLATAASPVSAGAMLLDASKITALSSNDRLTATNLEPSFLVGGKTVTVTDGKGISTPLDQTLHPVVGSAPALVGDAGIRPVAGNLTLLDLTHAPLGQGGLDPSIRPAVTVVKPPETDLTGVKTVIVGQILTGRLADGTALRPDPNGIIFSVKGAGAEVDPAGNRLLTVNAKIELVGQTTTTGVVGATTGIISGAVSEINIIGLTSTRAVRIGSDALVDSTHATTTGNPNGLTVAASSKANPLAAGGVNNDPTTAAAAGPASTSPTGQLVPPNSTAGAPVTPLGSGNPDEDKNNNGVGPGNTGVVVGNTVVPLPNVEFFDGKLSSTRVVASSRRTEEVVNDTLVHGALPPLAGMDQTINDILAARNGMPDPGIPNFDSNLSPISVFSDPKRFEPSGGIASTRFGDEIADGKVVKPGHRVDLAAEEGQVVDPTIHVNSTKELDSSTIDALSGKKEIGAKGEGERGTEPRPDASKIEDSELSDDVRNQMTTLLTDQSENLTGVSDRRTVKDFIDELLHHTKRRSYRIDSGDTLEKLARRFLKDKRLAHLIYLLNEDLFGNQADLSNIQLRTGQVLIMPSIEDVLQYRIHILHDVMPPHIYKNIIENPDERIVGSSKLLRATYSCRFGDRLTSIAARHSAIRDEKLWTLIAQLNGLSTLTNSSGQPQATLKRAQKLILPSRKDIEDHFRRSNHGAPATIAVETPSTPISNLDNEAVESASQVDEERATVNWGSGDDLPTPLSALGQKDENGSTLSNREPGPDSASKSGGNYGPNSKGRKSKPRRIAPNEARIVAPEDLGEGTEEIYLRLEFEYEGKWLPVIEYTGKKEQIYLHVYTLAGRTDSIPIALPTRSIRELAECDLGANYQRYCQRFLAGDRPI